MESFLKNDLTRERLRGDCRGKKLSRPSTNPQAQRNTRSVTNPLRRRFSDARKRPART